jgi:single-strand DNA-binding protein
MANFNKVILAGNLTRDPELRYTPKGTAIAKIGLAINRKWRSRLRRNEGGRPRSLIVSAFGKTAETIGQYLKKGRPDSDGRAPALRNRGTTRHRDRSSSKLGVVVESFQIHWAILIATAASGAAEAAPVRAPAATSASCARRVRTCRRRRAP